MRKSGFVVGTLLVGAWVGPALAEEAKTPVSASMLLSISAPTMESRQSAYDRSLKESGPAAPSSWVAQPDGSLRYGSGSTSVSVTVKNPCPPGTAHYEPPPLPGRRARY